MKQFLFTLPLLLILAFQCSDDTVAVQEESLFKSEALDSLCTYRVTNSDQATRQNSDQVIISVKDLTGQVIFINSENSYAIATSVNGTYDCQIIFFTSNDLRIRLNQPIRFSGNVVPYQGVYTPAVGGQKVFSINNITILN